MTIIYTSIKEKKMESKKVKALEDKVSRLQGRVSDLTDQVATLNASLQQTQTKVAKDMQFLAEKIGR